jgi:hypothetical protein
LVVSHRAYSASHSIRVQRQEDSGNPRKWRADYVSASIHPDDSRFSGKTRNNRSSIRFEDLDQRVSYVAAGALLARYWPTSAQVVRDEIAMALSGGLAQGGLV